MENSPGEEICAQKLFFGKENIGKQGTYHMEEPQGVKFLTLGHHTCGVWNYVLFKRHDHIQENFSL